MHELKRLKRPFALNKDRHIGAIESGVENDIFEFNGCPTLREAFELLKDPDFQLCIEQKFQLKAIGIVFNIDGEITEGSFKPPCTRKKRRYDETFQCTDIEIEIEIEIPEKFPINSLFNDSKKLMIAFQSTISGKCKIYWKVAKEKQFYCLNIDKQLSLDVTKFVIDFLIEELQSGFTGEKIRLKIFIVLYDCLFYRTIGRGKFKYHNGIDW